MQQECGGRSPDFSRGAHARLAAGALIVVAAVTAAVVLGSGGCTKTNPTATDPSARQVTVRVVCADPAGQALLATHVKSWADRAGAAVQVVPKAPAEAPDADLWLLPPAELAQWAGRGALRPVPERLFGPDDPFQGLRLLRIYRYATLRWNPTTFALPVLGEATVALYRRDLFADPAHRAAFQKRFGRPLPADGPATWQDVAEAAEYFRSPEAPAWEPGGRPAIPRVSLPPLPVSVTDLDREFFAVAAPLARQGLNEEGISSRGRGPDETAAAYAFHYDTRDGRSRLDQPGFVAALQLLQRLQACRPPGEVARPVKAFREGLAVFCLVPLAEVATLADSPVRDQVGVCAKVPGSRVAYDFQTGQPHEVAGGNFVPYLGAGGLLGAVPAASPHADAAFELLAHLAGPKTSLEVLAEPRWGGGPVREAHLNPAEGRAAWGAYDLPPEQAQRLGASLRALLMTPANPVLRLRTPGQAAHLEALMTEVRAALTQPGRDAQAALKAAAAKWQELDKGRDPAERLTEYKRSLGLAQ